MVNGDHADIFKPIWTSGWFTNHGPIARRLEKELTARSGFRECVLVGVEAIGVVMALDCLIGKICVPNHCSMTINAQSFLNKTLCSDARGADWLVICSSLEVTNKATERQKIALYLSDAASIQTYTALLLKDELSAKILAQTANLILFPMRSGFTIDSQGGVAILLSDAGLAAHLRNVRSSYGAGAPVSVGKTANGRISEAQCLLALSGLNVSPGN
jgi:hypothetical protein